jgi:hypothetical protein
MGVKHNSKNEPDVLGYEMKTGNYVTTFIDKAPTKIFINDEILSTCNKEQKN